jgi:hypothetical protein
MENSRPSHDEPAFAVSDQRPDVINKKPDDPAFVVSDQRPEVILNRRGLIMNVGMRSKSPLTDAVVTTLRRGGSVIVEFDDESHSRIANRFTMLQQRLRPQRIVFRHSFVFEEDKVEPVKVQWWCEQLTPEQKRAEEAAAPPAETREPVVGRDVE